MQNFLANDSASSIPGSFLLDASITSQSLVIHKVSPYNSKIISSGSSFYLFGIASLNYETIEVRSKITFYIMPNTAMPTNYILHNFLPIMNFIKRSTELQEGRQLDSKKVTQFCIQRQGPILPQTEGPCSPLENVLDDL